METKPLSFSRRFCAVVLCLAIGGQAMLADAAVSSVWSERRRPASPIDSLPLPAASLPKLTPASVKNAPPSFAFVSAIPATFGSIRSLEAGSAGRSVLLIQDIHLNQEAQANIASAVSALLRAGAVDLIGLEGAAGPLGLETIARAPDAASLSLAADFLLKQNMVSGAARAALDPTVSTPFIGLDDNALHESNAEAYRRAVPTTSSAKKSISAELMSVANAKSSVFNRELLGFDAAVNAYRGGRAAFSDYTSHLTSAAEKIHQPVPPALSLFVTLVRLEKSIDIPAVERERTAVIGRLARALDDTKARRLLELGNAFRAGLIRHSAFYAEFGSLCRASRIDLAATPALSAYLRYVSAADGVDPDETLRSAAELETRLYASLARTAGERLLVARDRRGHLAARLTAFEMTRPEWEEWATIPTTGDRLPSLTDFEAFYQRAVERDAAIADNVIAAMNARGARRAAVVAGGFHAEGLIHRLAARGINAAVFTPALSRVDAHGSDYLSVFTREKTPIESVLEGRALFLAQNPMSTAAKFAIVHLAAAHAVTAGRPAAAQASWISRATGWTVADPRSSRGSVRFEETDRAGRDVSVVVEGARADGFRSLPVVTDRNAAMGLGRLLRQTGLELRSWILSLVARLARAATSALQPAPLTVDATPPADVPVAPAVTDHPFFTLDEAIAGFERRITRSFDHYEALRKTTTADNDIIDERVRQVEQVRDEGSALIVRLRARSNDPDAFIAELRSVEEETTPVIAQATRLARQWIPGFDGRAQFVTSRVSVLALLLSPGTELGAMVTVGLPNGRTARVTFINTAVSTPYHALMTVIHEEMHRQFHPFDHKVEWFEQYFNEGMTEFMTRRHLDRILVRGRSADVQAVRDNIPVPDEAPEEKLLRNIFAAEEKPLTPLERFRKNYGTASGYKHQIAVVDRLARRIGEDAIVAAYESRRMPALADSPALQWAAAAQDVLSRLNERMAWRLISYAHENTAIDAATFAGLTRLLDALTTANSEVNAAELTIEFLRRLPLVPFSLDIRIIDNLPPNVIVNAVRAAVASASPDLVATARRIVLDALYATRHRRHNYSFSRARFEEIMAGRDPEFPLNPAFQEGASGESGGQGVMGLVARLVRSVAAIVQPAPLTITSNNEIRVALVALFTRQGQAGALKQLASVSDEALLGFDDAKKVSKAFRVNWKSGQVEAVATTVRQNKERKAAESLRGRNVPGAFKTPEDAFPVRFATGQPVSAVGTRVAANAPAPGFRRIVSDDDLSALAGILARAGIGMILDRNIAYVRHQMTRATGEVTMVRGIPNAQNYNGNREMFATIVLPDFLETEVAWVIQNRLRDIYPAQMMAFVNNTPHLRAAYAAKTPVWLANLINERVAQLPDASLPAQNEETLRRMTMSAILHEVGESIYLALDGRATVVPTSEAHGLTAGWRAAMWEGSYGGTVIKNHLKGVAGGDYFEWESFADAFALYLQPEGILSEFGETLSEGQREAIERILAFIRSEEARTPGGFFSIPLRDVDDHIRRAPPPEAASGIPTARPAQGAATPGTASRVLAPVAVAWRAAVVEIRRTLNPGTFVLNDHRNTEAFGVQKRAAGVAMIYAGMVWLPFKLGVALAMGTTLDPSLILLISISTIPVANILAHGAINTAWLAISPIHRGLVWLAANLESAAAREAARYTSFALEPAPLTIDNPYEDRLRDYLSTISSPDEAVNQGSQTFNAMADETEFLIQSPMERAKIFEAWANALVATRYPLERFLAAFLRRWIGREPQNIFTWMREITTVMARHAEDTRTPDLQRLVTESFADAAAQLQNEIFLEHSERKDSQPIRLVEITPEVAPFRKAGGMGMVNGILPLEFNKFHGWATTISLRYDDGDYTGEEIVTVDGRRTSPPLRFTVEIPGEPRPRVGTATKIRVYSSDGVTFADKYFFRDNTRGPTNLTQVTYMKGFDEVLKYKQAVFMSEGALQLMKMLVKSGQMKKPDAVRAHDWQAGLAPIYMKTRSYAEDPEMRDLIRGVRTMSFFHNLEPGYRGEIPPEYWYLLGLGDENKQAFGWEHVTRLPDGSHRLDGFNENKMMVTKAMANSADAMFVPAPTYALMVQTSEYGHDMHSMFGSRWDALNGVLNGTEYDKSAEFIFPKGPRPLQDFVDHKRRAKIALLKELRPEPPTDQPNRTMPSMWESIEAGVRARLGEQAQASEIDAAMQVEIDRPVVGAIVRLDVGMKGTNMYLALVRKLTRNQDGQYIRFVLMGTEENAKEFVPQMAAEAAAAPDRIYFLPKGGKGLNQPIRDINLGGPILSLNNLIEAGIDIPAYPSKVEPCGLSDVQGLNRGGVVVVSAAGGFKDKNYDIAEERDGKQATGVMFGPVFGDDRPTLKQISARFDDVGFVWTVERLLDVYYNDRGHFNWIAGNNANLRFTNEDMARGHILSLAHFLNRTDIQENPQKPYQKAALGAVAAWRSLGVRNPIVIGVLEGALTVLSIAVAISVLMPIGPPATASAMAIASLVGITVVSSAGVLSFLWAAHFLSGVIETDGTISIGDSSRATAATRTAAWGLVALPLLLIPFLLDAVTAWHFIVAAAGLAGITHGGMNAHRNGSRERIAHPMAAPLVAITARDLALGRDVARALVDRIPLARRQRAWVSALESRLRSQPARVGVAAMAERPLPSLAPMDAADFDEDAFLGALHLELQGMGALHSAEPARARAAAEAVAFAGLANESAAATLAALDESRLNIVVFDGMRGDDAARAIERIRMNPDAKVVVLADPTNQQTRGLIAQAAALSNVTVVSDGKAFGTSVAGGRTLVLSAVETRLTADRLIAPSLHIFAGKGLELDTDGLGDGSPFRAALYTILDALASVTASYNRMSLLDASYRLIASQA